MSLLLPSVLLPSVLLVNLEICTRRDGLCEYEWVKAVVVVVVCVEALLLGIAVPSTKDLVAGKEEVKLIPESKFDLRLGVKVSSTRCGSTESLSSAGSISSAESNMPSSESTVSVSYSLLLQL